jgi:hypothetical protein
LGMRNNFVYQETRSLQRRKRFSGIKVIKLRIICDVYLISKLKRDTNNCAFNCRQDKAIWSCSGS